MHAAESFCSWVGILAALLGSALVLINLWLVIGRGVVHRLRRLPGKPTFVSGAPAIGSTLLWIGAVFLSIAHSRLWIASLVISVLDPLGLHVFLVTMILAPFISQRGRRL